MSTASGEQGVQVRQAAGDCDCHRVQGVVCMKETINKTLGINLT
jgi:hypothetical protein